MVKQQQKLLASLVLLVENVRDPDRLVPVLKDLEAKHKEYGVIEKYYPAVETLYCKLLSNTSKTIGQKMCSKPGQRHLRRSPES
jgi:hemoglobin-like flavoprotein